MVELGADCRAKEPDGLDPFAYTDLDGLDEPAVASHKARIFAVLQERIALSSTPSLAQPSARAREPTR